MTTPAFEAFLAKIYVDPEFRATFLADPGAAATFLGAAAVGRDQYLVNGAPRSAALSGRRRGAHTYTSA